MALHMLLEVIKSIMVCGLDGMLADILSILRLKLSLWSIDCRTDVMLVAKTLLQH
jgi:hypothetical protein